MATEILEHTGLVIEETPPEALNLALLDTFAYKYKGKAIHINFTCPEFTAICPFSEFPDFATIKIEYVPNELCIELKSLKLYINSFREAKMFHEHVINRILDDFVKALAEGVVAFQSAVANSVIQIGRWYLLYRSCSV